MRTGVTVNKFCCVFIRNYTLYRVFSHTVSDFFEAACFLRSLTCVDPFILCASAIFLSRSRGERIASNSCYLYSSFPCYIYALSGPAARSVLFGEDWTFSPPPWMTFRPCASRKRVRRGLRDVCKREPSCSEREISSSLRVHVRRRCADNSQRPLPHHFSVACPGVPSRVQKWNGAGIRVARASLGPNRLARISR